MWLEPEHGGRSDDVRVLLYQAALTPKRSVPYHLDYGTTVRQSLRTTYGRAAAGRLRQEIRQAALPDADLYVMPANNFFTGGLNPTITFRADGETEVNAEITVKPDNARIRVQVA